MGRSVIARAFTFKWSIRKSGMKMSRTLFGFDRTGDPASGEP